jgi:hypothetical protein
VAFIGSCKAPHCPKGAPIILCESEDGFRAESNKSRGSEDAVLLLPFEAAAGVPKFKDAKSSRTNDSVGALAASLAEAASSSSNEIRSVILAVGTASAPPLLGSMLGSMTSLAVKSPFLND